ncbi:MAG: hypothetical protein ABFD62_00115 [Syntrophaceae bacterium]
MSVGVVLYDPKNPVSLDDLISKADERMYQEKSRKKLSLPAARS